MRRLLCVLWLLPALAGADERILSFHSDIRVFADGQIEVTETIQVNAEGKQIRRGIYRDFPVDYEDRLGNAYRIKLRPLTVLRNDKSEPFHSRRSGRDVRVYFGSQDRFVPQGVHTYRFRYRVDRMLGFFDEHDELYWNVTGNRWAFPINAASATVRFEFGEPVDALFVDGFTGRYGSSAQDYSRRQEPDGALRFVANRSLPASHGLTIVVGWPKGHVAEPTLGQRAVWLLKDNRNLLAALAGFLLLLGYYVPVWRRHGRDPEEGPIVTRYEPPGGFSPASLRYIRQMYYDNKVMTAAIVSLAVKGFVKIENNGDEHVLHRVETQPDRSVLAAGEAELFDAMFEDGDTVELKNDNHKILGKARTRHKMSLLADYKQNYFVTNGRLNLPAIAIVLLATVFAMAAGDGPTPMVIGVTVLSFVTMAFFAIIMKRPTLRGRKVLDEMLGFKDFLEIAEKDELNLRNPPEKTPALFESYLPYALALGVDQQWAERFARVLAAIRGEDGESYKPTWYSGSWNSASLSDTATGLSSGLNSAVSSSVSPPGSSSGGGGGGFSGGGGGGGGGGGW